VLDEVAVEAEHAAAVLERLEAVGFLARQPLRLLARLDDVAGRLQRAVGTPASRRAYSGRITNACADEPRKPTISITPASVEPVESFSLTAASANPPQLSSA
jgi:hypothetical protein